MKSNKIQTERPVTITGLLDVLTTAWNEEKSNKNDY